MPSVSIVSALLGVSSLLGLLSLLAYFFVGQKGEQTDSIIEVMGHRVDLALEIELIKQFETDAAKLKALQKRHDHNDALSQAILSKIRDNVDVRDGGKARDRRYLIAAVVFIVLALLGFLSAILQNTRESEKAPGLAPAAPSASAANGAGAPSASTSSPAPSLLLVGKVLTQVVRRILRLFS